MYHEDIRKFDMSKLAPIDALAFGFPCNDYSVVGEQKGMDGVYGPLYSYGVKSVENVQAAMVSRRKCWWIKKCK